MPTILFSRPRVLPPPSSRCVVRCLVLLQLPASSTPCHEHRHSAPASPSKCPLRAKAGATGSRRGYAEALSKFPTLIIPPSSAQHPQSPLSGILRLYGNIRARMRFESHVVEEMWSGACRLPFFPASVGSKWGRSLWEVGTP
jgi:hypothetical protein